MPLIDKGKFSKNENGEFGEFKAWKHTAFHFDAVKFANWLRDGFCVPRGVKHISGLVKTINTDENGISDLVLEDGSIVSGDLYVDCTGFKSLLLGDALKEPFTSYTEMLPNNRAWATRLKYTNKEKELKNYTNCTALGNGWVWEIPTWSRLGTGYVYSDKFVSKEEALDEYKNYLKKDRGVDNPDDLEFKDIEMRIGIYERTWVKNVLAIGLSAGFIEPLESSGLYTVHEFLLPALRFLRKDVISRYDQDMYNRYTVQTFDNFAQFVALHYALSSRRDTDYWKEISNKCFDERVYKRIVNLSSGGFSEFSDRNIIFKEHNPDHGIHCIATGSNYFTLDLSVIKYQQFYDEIDHKEMIDQYIPMWEQLKFNASMAADRCPSVYEYLKEEIYND